MPTQRDYRQTLWYLYSFTDYEQKGMAAYAPENYNLARMRKLLSLIDDPHLAFRSIHVAGTKGKGSTAAMIESVLRTAGYRTGLYTSPHMHTFRERVQISGKMIPEADLIRMVDKIGSLAEQVEGITTFEVMTALTFRYFADHGVEWAVVEVGLGGRLDATNVVIPEVAVITSLSLDHTAILGDTLAKIAAEKAGIIKPGRPVVCAPQKEEALAVVEATAERLGAPLTLVGRDWLWQAGEANDEGQTFAIQEKDGQPVKLSIPLLGSHQLENATTAAAALSLLADAGMIIDNETLQEGFKRVSWPGRIEILGRKPLVIADSAHNGDSARKLISTLTEHCTWDRMIVIIGVSTDHATPELFSALLSGADLGIATQSRHPRAADPAWLQERAAEVGYHMECVDSVPGALETALAEAQPGDLICGTGSVFVAAELREAWFRRQALPVPEVDPL
jgi:dihydrofolate synthase/folylpolyglutamate synthase